MSNQKDNLKAKLLAQAEAAIEQMLSDERLSATMKVSDIEALISVTEADFRERLLREIVAMQQANPTCCPECGGKLRHKGQRDKRIVTLRGEMDVRRTYYQCEACGTGYFPPR